MGRLVFEKVGEGTGADGDVTIGVDASDEWSTYMNIVIGNKVYSSVLVEWVVP